MDTLRVFISWSGSRSEAIAKHLKAWLPDVIRNADPWLSSEDLAKGAQWLPELNSHLTSTGFGLLVLTPENKDAPWLLFEAGVISKALPGNHCCPLLCDLKQTDISGPLAQFQATAITSKEDMYKLVKTMNEASGTGKVEDDRVEKWFSKSWDEFESAVRRSLTDESSVRSHQRPKPSQPEILEEILTTVRRIATEIRQRPEEHTVYTRLSDDQLQELDLSPEDLEKAIIANSKLSVDERLRMALGTRARAILAARRGIPDNQKVAAPVLSALRHPSQPRPRSEEQLDMPNVP